MTVTLDFTAQIQIEQPNSHVQQDLGAALAQRCQYHVQLAHLESSVIWKQRVNAQPAQKDDIALVLA